MGLSIDNIRLLTLTQRKADLEYNIAIDSMEKMAIAREQSQLSQEYSSRLQAKNIAYYANNKYNQMDYTYLMGATDGTSSVTAMALLNPELYGGTPIKKDNSMILTDAFGLVVMSDGYAKALKKILGPSCVGADGKGGTFSTDKIPALIAEVAGTTCTEEDVKKVIDGGMLQYGYSVAKQTTLTGETNSTGNEHDASDRFTSKVEDIVNFFYPIFLAAATNGWTTEYNRDMTANTNYVSDALVTGSFQLAQVGSDGNYEPNTSLTYFVTSGLVLERTDSDIREQVTAWYNAEKERINEKESWIDIELQDLSTELEATNTEMETLKSQLEDDMKPFEWCT